MPKKILVVEDDKDLLWILRETFGVEKDIEVFYALDGEEGLAMAEKEKPDLMLIDILLPKMDGIIMSKKITEKGIKTHKIFFTNSRDLEHMNQAMEAGKGEVEYIVKADIHIDDVVKRVKQKLGI